jgi:hypothetical protein
LHLAGSLPHPNPGSSTQRTVATVEVVGASVSGTVVGASAVDVVVCASVAGDDNGTGAGTGAGAGGVGGDIKNMPEKLPDEPDEPDEYGGSGSEIHVGWPYSAASWQQSPDDSHCTSQ